MKTVKLNGEVLTVNTDNYARGGALAVSLRTKDDHPYCVLSVNMPDIELASDEFIGKNYSENIQAFIAVRDAGLIKETGRVIERGFLRVPVCTLV